MAGRDLALISIQWGSIESDLFQSGRSEIRSQSHQIERPELGLGPCKFGMGARGTQGDRELRLHISHRRRWRGRIGVTGVGLYLAPEHEMHVPVLAVFTVVVAVAGLDVLCQSGVAVDDLARFMVGVQDRGRTTPQAEAQHHPDQCPEKPGTPNDRATGVRNARRHTFSVPRKLMAVKPNILVRSDQEAASDGSFGFQSP